MTPATLTLPNVLAESPVRVVFGSGVLSSIGPEAARIGAKRVLIVTDPGIRQAGYVERAAQSLEAAGLDAIVFDGSRENPTTRHVAAGVEVARDAAIDLIIGLGGGSSMDCAKGINLILTNGGDVADYWGEGKARARLLPSIMAPTTAGTGSEAQSFALITDPVTHQKMACADRRLPADGGLRPHVAILDSDLTVTQPPAVAAASAIDAISHAVETAATTKRNATSLEFTRQAWLRLSPAIEIVLTDPQDETARQNMLLGAHLAGAAIERSMLGAAHACANPLTSKFGIVHGQAVGAMLPHVVRFNGDDAPNPYEAICSRATLLADQIERMLGSAKLKTRLRDLGVGESDLPALAEGASKQWTATFNPRPVTAADLLEIYKAAL